jgi:hypothetical protein
MIAALAVACSIFGSGNFTVPDNGCTPGAYAFLNKTQVCTSKRRPGLSAADRRQIVTEYGVPNWSGRNGELDHRVPFFLGGKTNENNVWPERGPIPNVKDRLEFYVFDRVCHSDPYPMRIRTARRIFLADWRASYCFYIQDRPRSTCEQRFSA